MNVRHTLLLLCLVSGCRADTPTRPLERFKAGASLLPLAGQQPNWVLRSPANLPPPREGHGIGFDAARGQVVLFAGMDFGGRRNDTWVWDGTSWTQKGPATSPPPRYLHAMAYDAARGQVIIFGGTSSSSFLNDTWVWDGTNWTQKAPGTSPPPRARSGMAYDAARGEVVIFGGWDGGHILGDTWVWDGTNWTQKSPTTSPPPLSAAAMAYDAARGQVMLFGGEDFLDYRNGTWVWDGSNWTQESPSTSPPPRSGHAMAFDAARGQAIMFGGTSSSSFLNDTWVWDGSNWTQQSPLNSPMPLYMTAMAYDAARGEVVLFGGETAGAILNDTWSWPGVPPSSITVTLSKQTVDPVGTVASAPAPCFNAVSQVATTGNLTSPRCPGGQASDRSSDQVSGTITVTPPLQGVVVAISSWRRKDSGAHLEPFHQPVNGRFKDSQGNWQPTLTLAPTDQNGNAFFHYQSSGVGGVDSVAATLASSPVGFALLTVQYRGLAERVPIPGLLRQGSITSHHGNVWFGTPSGNLATEATARNYQGTGANELVVTAASLPFGGLADVKFNWTIKPGHITHRKGREFDFISSVGNGMSTLAQLQTAAQLAGGTCKIETFPNPSNNHTHCSFP